MSQIKELKPRPGITLLAVKLPEGAMLPYIHRNRLLFDLPKCECDMIKLPEGNWQLLGIATEIPEEVWQGIVESRWDYYKNYLCPKDGNVGNYKRLVCITATESAMSFLSAHDIDPNSIILMKQND